MVRYEAAANTGSQRSATISVGGRAFTVVQAAPNQASGIAVIPNSGSGYAQTFTFTYWDPRGADYIWQAGAEIKDYYGPRTCGFLLTFPVPGYPRVHGAGERRRGGLDGFQLEGGIGRFFRNDDDRGCHVCSGPSELVVHPVGK